MAPDCIAGRVARCRPPGASLSKSQAAGVRAPRAGGCVSASPLHFRVISPSPTLSARWVVGGTENLCVSYQGLDRSLGGCLVMASPEACPAWAGGRASVSKSGARWHIAFSETASAPPLRPVS